MYASILVERGIVMPSLLLLADYIAQSQETEEARVLILNAVLPMPYLS